MARTRSGRSDPDGADGDPMAIPMEREVLEIKKLKGILAQSSAAKQYDVHPSTISGIWTGKTWRHL